MPRGGYRRGQPGQSYDNRTDLNAAPRVASGVPSQPVYGDKVRQAESLRAAPLPQSAPIQITPLDAPTQRVNEDVAHGLPVGPGAGPEALMTGGDSEDLLFALRAAYDAFPSPDLLRLLLDEEARRG